MIDTIKLGVPLTEKQFNQIQKIAYAASREQWTLFNPKTGELRFLKVSGLATTDQYSYHREIRWDIPSDYGSETYLTVELSLPKLWYGHNIDLLYEFTKAITLLKELLERSFKLTGKNKLSDYMGWQVWRVDACYAWKLPTQQCAFQCLNALKHLHYPRKKPHIYHDSISFIGSTYSVKFYLKLPEFKQHDLKELLKNKLPLEWINCLEDKADGVLRYEATLRRKYLKRQVKIETVKDLVEPVTTLLWDEESKHEGFEAYASIMMITWHYLLERGVEPNEAIYKVTCDNEEGELKLEDGQVYTAPPMELDINGNLFKHSGGGFTVKKESNLIIILQYFLKKFLGENVKMQSADEVSAKLLSTYKTVKAARLIGFWLYIQKFGSQDAKEKFGRDSFYRSKSDLKKAGVSLVEPPSNVIEFDRDAYQSFRYQIPSPIVINKVDNFRDSDNILNYRPRRNTTEGNA
jgi:hypothetical protein